jgi:hypothetical protein
MKDLATHDESEFQSPLELATIPAKLLPVMVKACPPCVKVTLVVAVAIYCYFFITQTFLFQLTSFVDRPSSVVCS